MTGAAEAMNTTGPASNLPCDAELLKVICCPETHQELTPAPAATVEELNARIGGGSLRNRAGQVVSERMQAGLTRSDGKFLYPVRHGIPILLVDEAIPLEDR